MLLHERIIGLSAGNPETAHSAPNRQLFRAMLVVVIALSTYLYLPLVSGGRLLVPSYTTVALIPLLFMTVRRRISNSDVAFLLKIVFVLLLSITLSPGYIYLTQKFLSLAQFTLAISVTVMTVRLMQQLRPEILERALLTLWCLLLIGSVLEVTGFTREVSDTFRVWAYKGMYTLYDGDNRDITFVGWVRPKVFSTEPSNVSKMFIVSINSWLLMRTTATKAAVVAVATGAMFVIMGSPMFVVSAAMTLAILVWNPRASIQARVATALAALAVGLLLLTLFGDAALSTLAARVDTIGATQEGGQLEIRSENLRAIVPWLTLIDTWSRWPIFGVGFGGKEVVLEVSRFSRINSVWAMGSNAAAQVGIYLGILGGTLFTWLTLRHAFDTGVRRIALLLLVVVLFSLLMGGLDSFRYWGYVALLWGALAVADSSEIHTVNRLRCNGPHAGDIDRYASA